MQAAYGADEQCGADATEDGDRGHEGRPSLDIGVDGGGDDSEEDTSDTSREPSGTDLRVLVTLYPEFAASGV